MGSRKKSKSSSQSTATVTSAPVATSSHPTTGGLESSKQTPELKVKRSLQDRFRAMRDELVTRAFQFMVFSPLLIVLSPIVYVPCYRSSLKGATFTVDRRERVTKGSGDSQQSYYLVWSREGEVFCVTDTWSFLRFDSADRYGKLREGSLVEAQVAGWRVPFLSWYRNVVDIKSIQE